MKNAIHKRLELSGLSFAPPQTWGAVRLVPLLRREIRGDLRLSSRRYPEDVAVVALEGQPRHPSLVYASFIPHGLVVEWSADGAPVASFGTTIAKRGADGKALRARSASVRLLHRMAKREDEDRLRILPLHLAMEGFLALHFGGPEIAWAEYSRETMARGLSPRGEASVRGEAIAGLGEALRVFEIHERQVGVLVFVADALASAFVVPHPEDYRALHRSLLEDFYGELLYRYGLMYRESTPAWASIDEATVSSLGDLRASVERMRAQWADFAATLAAGAIGAEVRAERVHRMAPFQLERLLPDFEPGRESHLGEAIVRDGGEIEYLKTYRLSDAQVRRACLLQTLATHAWSLEETAAALGSSRDELVRRLGNAGLGYMLRPHVLDAARAGRAGKAR